MDIWSKVAALKKRREWTDYDLAKALGLKSKSWLYNIRRGLAGPSSDAAFKLVALLEEERLVRGEQQRNAAIVAFLRTHEATPTAAAS